MQLSVNYPTINNNCLTCMYPTQTFYIRRFIFYFK